MPILQYYVRDHDNYIQDGDLSVYTSDPFICITDRTQADVDRVKYLTEVILAGTNTEHDWEEFQMNLKGALNYSDLDRIEKNLHFLEPRTHITFIEMSRDVIPRVPYFKKLLTNIKMLRDSNYRFYSTPLTPDMPLNTYQKINDIEKIIFDAYLVWVRNSSSYMYCGTDLYGDGNEII